jgi:hypothetical protein
MFVTPEGVDRRATPIVYTEYTETGLSYKT